MVGDSPGGLRRERPANNLVRDPYFETMVAIYARNLLVGRLRDFSSIGNMDVLFGFTACAFHSHYEVTFFWHYRVSVSHNTAHRLLAHRCRVFLAIIDLWKVRQSDRR